MAFDSSSTVRAVDSQASSLTRFVAPHRDRRSGIDFAAVQQGVRREHSGEHHGASGHSHLPPQAK